MEHRSIELATGSLLGVVAVAHLLRVALQWDVVVNGWILPKGVSMVAFFVGGFLSYSMFKG